MYNGIRSSIEEYYAVYNKEKFYYDLQNCLIDFSNKKNIKDITDITQITDITDILKDINSNRFYKIEELLTESIKKGNIMLPRLLLNQDNNFPYSFNFNLNSISDGLSSALNVARDDYKNEFEKIIKDYFTGKDVLVSGFTINYRPIFSDSVNKENKIRLINQSRDIINNFYYTNKDKLKKYFGFENTALHFFASEYSLTINIDYDSNPFPIDIDINACLKSKNSFNQVPLGIAFLYKNKHFIDSFIKEVKNKGISKNEIQEFGYQIGLMLAKSSLDKSFIEETVNKLKEIGITTSHIKVSDPNKVERIAVYDAVKYSNYPFVNWWISGNDKTENRRSLNFIDKNGNNLWHEFFSSTTKIKEIKSDIKKFNIQLLSDRIFRLLYKHIGDLINQSNAYGEPPIKIALGDPFKFELLLNGNNLPEGKAIKFRLDNIDPEGNTIVHYMAYEFISYRDKDYIKRRKKIVNSLIPHLDKIKDFYNKENKYKKTSIKIIEEYTAQSFSEWLHHKVGIDLIQRSGHNFRVCIEYKSQCSDEIDSQIHIPFPVEYEDGKDYKYKYDNKLLLFHRKVLTEINRIDRLSYYTRSLIRALLPEIIYSNVNPEEDKLYHVLVSRKLIEAGTEITLFNILKEIREFRKEYIEVIYDTPNRFGQLLSHLSILFNRISILEFGLKYYPDLINKETVVDPKNIKYIASKLDLIEENIKEFKFYPADYAIILMQNEAIELFKNFVKENRIKTKDPNFRIPCNLPESYIEKNNKEFYPYIRSTDKLGKIDEKLIIRKSIDYILKELKDKSDKDNKYFAIPSKYDTLLNRHVNFLINQNKLLNEKEDTLKVYEKEFYSADRFYELSGVLEKYVKELSAGNYKNYPNKMIPILLGTDGHASAIIVFRDKDDQFHAFLQDSQSYLHYESSEENKKKSFYKVFRLDPITKILQEKLPINGNNIYDLNVKQQNTCDSNCSLWAIANIKSIQYSILKRIKKVNDPVSCMLNMCISDQELSVNDKFIPDNILNDIKNDIIEYAPKLVDNLQNFITKISNNEIEYNLSEEKIRQKINKMRPLQ